MTSNNREIEMLVDDPNALEAQQYAALVKAINTGDIDAAEMVLIRAGVARSALLEHKDENDWTLLMHAVEAERPAMVRLLAGHGANLDPRYQPGTTPLFRAAAVLKSIDVVRALVEHGADKNFRSASEESILMKSIPFGDEDSEIALYLIEQGAACGEDVKAKGKYSAASLACTYDNPEVFLALVKAGALDSIEKPPIQYAAEEGSLPVVEACLADPELCAPARNLKNNQLIEACVAEEIRQAILSWSSAQSIEAALTESTGIGVAPARASRGISL